MAALCISNCTLPPPFVDGTSLPEADRPAAALGIRLALLDRDGVYGAPRSPRRERAGIKAIVGAELTVSSGLAFETAARTRGQADKRTGE
jgi:hypothetical protein